MNSNIFSKEVEKSFNWLIDLGFQFRRVDTNIYFEQTNANEAFAIGFAWSEYNQIHLYGLTAYKRFNKVESKLHEATGRPLDYTIKHRWNGDVPEELERISDEDHPAFNSFYLENKSHVILFSDMVKKFLHGDANLFFDQFKSIEDVIEWLKTHDVKEHAELLVQNNNTQMLRRLILMKEGHSEDFADLYQRYSAFLMDKYEKKETPYSEMYEMFSKLSGYFTHS